MLTLIDADLVTYRCAASSENDNEDIATTRCDSLLRDILHTTGATEYEAYLTGSNNFRKKIDPTYKANRTDPRPKYLEACREFLVTQWKASVTDGDEADDEVGRRAFNLSQLNVPFTVSSLDKDLFQIPGKHYQWEIRGVIKGKEWVKPAAFHYITPLDGIKHFYKQMLIGDKSDNVFGVDNIGPVKAGKAIDPLSDENDMFSTVWNFYSDKQKFYRNAQLLWILKQTTNPQEVLLHFHSLQLPDEAQKLLSSLISQETHDLGLEPIVPMTTTQPLQNGFQ